MQYAVIETNGSLSVMKNPENETPTVSQFGFKTEKRGIPVLAVNDGRYIDTAINESEEISKKTVEKILKKENADVKEVLIMLIARFKILIISTPLSDDSALKRTAFNIMAVDFFIFIIAIRYTYD